MPWSDKKHPNRITGRPWRRLRDQVFKRDGYLCVVCKLENRLTPATVCDHVVPLAKGGMNDLDNLQALCAEHDDLKTRIDNGAKPRKGIGVDGFPIDPLHHWNRKG